MATVINWIEQIENVQKICASLGLIAEVESDKNAKGINTKLIFQDIPVEKTGNIYGIDFQVDLEVSTIKKNWKTLIQKMQLLTEKLSDDTRLLFSGWTIIEDDSNLVYQGGIILKNISNDF